ncbi:MAG: GDP-L-fucose synthase [Thermodesulfovibrionia bacterium]
MVGSAILRSLEGKGYKNLIYRSHSKLDLTRQSDVERFFEDARPEYVFLAAAKVGGILANDTYKAEFIYDNIAIAINVIHSAYKTGVKKLLNLGSSCIYPKYAPQPMREDTLLTGTLEPTNEPYAIAKISALKLCRYYNEQYGTNFISVMPTNLYGPNDNFNLETAHALPALIRKFHLARLLRIGSLEDVRNDIKRYTIGFGLDKGISDNDEAILNVLKKVGITAEYVTLWGSGEVYREFMHVDDLAEACIFLMDGYDFTDIGEFVNVGTGEDIKIKELAMMIKEIVGFDGEIIYDTSMPDGTPRKLLDVSRINGLGWRARIGLRDGIRNTYMWYLDGLKGG